MPLTEFQATIARLLAVNRTPDSHLAGGAALHFEPQSLRYSNDLDYFHDSENRVGAAFALDQKLLSENNYSLQVAMKQPGFIRAIVGKDLGATKVEWSHDSAWRFMPTLFAAEIGYYLHPADLATNKVLALAGRDEARDYLDVHDIHQRILPLGALVWAACGKDPGFTPNSLLDLLRRRGKYQKEDFLRLKLAMQVDLTELKGNWFRMLEEAENFIKQRPASEVGCLYYSLSNKKFVLPDFKSPIGDVIPHFGTLKGILPKVGDV